MNYKIIENKTYCLCEASTAEAIREATEAAGLPADVVIEVGELGSGGTTGPIQKDRFADN